MAEADSAERPIKLAKAKKGFGLGQWQKLNTIKKTRLFNQNLLWVNQRFH